MIIYGHCRWIYRDVVIQFLRSFRCASVDRRWAKRTSKAKRLKQFDWFGGREKMFSSSSAQLGFSLARCPFNEHITSTRQTLKRTNERTNESINIFINSSNGSTATIDAIRSLALILGARFGFNLNLWSFFCVACSNFHISQSEVVRSHCAAIPFQLNWFKN